MSTEAIRAVQDAADMADYAKIRREVNALTDGVGRHERILAGLGPDLKGKLDAMARVIGLDSFDAGINPNLGLRSGIPHA